MKNNKWLSVLETLAISLVGVAIFYIFHIPLPWLLGSLTMVTTWKMITKRDLYWPSGLRNTGLVILGYMLGTSFSRESAWYMVQQLPSMLLMTVLTILCSMAMAYFISRYTNINVASAVFGCMPGGLSHMVTLSEEINQVDETVVTFMQTIRIILVIFLVPFFVVHGLSGHVQPLEIPAGSSQENIWASIPWYSYVVYALGLAGGIWALLRFRFLGAYITGALLITMSLVLAGVPAPELPSLPIIMAQLFIGSHLGGKTNLTQLRNWKTLGPYTIGLNIVLISFSFLLGLVLTWWYPLSIHSAFLSMAPGGVAEMGITAREVNADLSVVTSYQLFRIFFIIFLIPSFLKWWTHKYALEPDSMPESDGMKSSM